MCVCLTGRDQDVCMILVIAFVQMYLQAMLPFSFLLFCNFKLDVKPTTPAIPKEHHSRGFR